MWFPQEPRSRPVPRLLLFGLENPFAVWRPREHLGVSLLPSCELRGDVTGSSFPVPPRKDQTSTPLLFFGKSQDGQTE